MTGKPLSLERLAWSALSIALYANLNIRPHLSITRPLDGVWRVVQFGVSLEISFLREKQQVRVTRRLRDGYSEERLYTVTCLTPGEPVIADSWGNIAAPHLFVDELLEWLSEASTSEKMHD